MPNTHDQIANTQLVVDVFRNYLYSFSH